MGLVSLQAAKDHLNVKGHDFDADIAMKLEQASDIVIDYLKGRAHKRAVIASSSVDTVTVITTVSDHTFVNGESVILLDHVGSVPAVDGVYVIGSGGGNVTRNTFTIPLTVTTAGTGGSAKVLWTADTAPKPVQAAVLLMLAHLRSDRGDGMDAADLRLWEAIGRLLVRFRDPALA